MWSHALDELNVVHQWHAETVEADVVGYTGRAAQACGAAAVVVGGGGERLPTTQAVTKRYLTPFGAARAGGTGVWVQVRVAGGRGAQVRVGSSWSAARTTRIR